MLALRHCRHVNSARLPHSHHTKRCQHGAKPLRALKAACLMAFLTALEVSAATVAGTEAEGCQSGSLIQQRPGLDTAKTLKPLEKKLQKRKKLEKLQKLLGESRARFKLLSQKA